MSHVPQERHACHCGKSFFRREHLRRHQATHGERSFVCRVCQRAFTRNDLLRRHAALHQSVAVPDARRGRACDACHENKTKCSGGKQCQLCDKRGIDCTYSRGAAPDSLESHSVIEASAPTQHSSDNSHGNPEPDVDPNSAKDGSPQPLTEALTESLSASRSPSESRFIAQADQIWQDDNYISRSGLQSILSAVNSTRPGAEKPQMPRASGDYKRWLSDSIQTYFGRTHERWPLIQHQVFDESTAHTTVVASIAMVGSWFREPDSLRDSIIDIHHALVAHLFTEMAERSGVCDGEKPWPSNMFKTLILNVIFALETGRNSLISRARILHGMCIAAMRELGIFDAEAINDHEQTFFPGSFLPWAHSNSERWKRIVFCSLKLDTYMSVLRMQPPAIRRDELNIGLLSNFSLWNAHGIHVFFRRHPFEKPDRSRHTMSDLTTNSTPFLPSGLMMEDVQIGLCGLWQPVWTSAGERRAGAQRAPLDNASEGSLSAQLDMWKIQLDGHPDILHGSDNPPRTSCLHTLVKMYAGKEEPGEEGWEEPVLHRVASFIFNASMLYHLLSINLATDMQVVNRFAYGSNIIGGKCLRSAAVDHDQTRRLYEWVQTPSTRKALLHSLYALASYEEHILLSEARGESLDPIAHIAVAAAAAVIWTWIINTNPTCTCLLRTGHVGVVMESGKQQTTPDVDNWLRDGGCIVADSVPLCFCARNPWMARVTTALARGGQVWEMNGVMARDFLSKMRDLGLTEAPSEDTELCSGS